MVDLDSVAAEIYHDCVSYQYWSGTAFSWNYCHTRTT